MTPGGKAMSDLSNQEARHRTGTEKAPVPRASPTRPDPHGAQAPQRAHAAVPAVYDRLPGRMFSEESGPEMKIAGGFDPVVLKGPKQMRVRTSGKGPDEGMATEFQNGPCLVVKRQKY